MKNPEKNLDNDFAVSSTTGNLPGRVREELLALPYSAFLLLIAQLLKRQGYRQVRLVGRKGFVGRNRGGGWDLEATTPGHPTLIASKAGSRCIIQAKQFDELAVQQRSMDELRGCILRAEAGLGLLITTSRFSPVAQEAAQASSLAPVLLLNGDGLVSLLIQQRFGIRKKPGGSWEVDPIFFQAICEEASLVTAGVQPEKMQRRNSSWLLSSSSSANDLPKRRKNSLMTPPQSHVLHLSIVLSKELGCRKEPELNRNKTK